MALNPTVYAELLDKRLAMTGAQTWLINTGWIRGPYGTGERIAIKETRKMVRAILNDAFSGTSFRKDPVFGFEVPETCPGVDDGLLRPREMWEDREAYDRAYGDLAAKFRESFDQFRQLVSPAVAEAGP